MLTGYKQCQRLPAGKVQLSPAAHLKNHLHSLSGDGTLPFVQTVRSSTRLMVKFGCQWLTITDGTIGLSSSSSITGFFDSPVSRFCFFGTADTFFILLSCTDLYNVKAGLYFASVGFGLDPDRTKYTCKYILLLFFRTPWRKKGL